MPYAKHQLPKRDLLEYALEGARAHRGINFERMSNDELELNEKDMAEIQRRIKLVDIAAARQKEE